MFDGDATCLTTEHEEQRLLALQACNVLDTPDEAVYDALTDLARTICGTSIGLVSLVQAQSRKPSCSRLPMRPTILGSAATRWSLENSAFVSIVAFRCLIRRDTVWACCAYSIRSRAGSAPSNARHSRNWLQW